MRYAKQCNAMQQKSFFFHMKSKEQICSSTRQVLVPTDVSKYAPTATVRKEGILDKWKIRSILTSPTALSTRRDTIRIC